MIQTVFGPHFFWDLDLGSTYLRQDSEMTLPRGSVSDLPLSLKKSSELVCLRTARSLLQTLPRRLSQNPSSDRLPGPNFCNDFGPHLGAFAIQERNAKSFLINFLGVCWYHARRKSVRSDSWGSRPDTDTDTYPLTRNYCENNSLRIIFRNFWWILHSRNLQERTTFSRNYVWDSQFLQNNYIRITFRK